MDVISHGLWSYVIANRKIKFWEIFLFSMWPDFIWVPLTLLPWFGYVFPAQEVPVPPILSSLITTETMLLPIYPDYAYALYDIPHSLLICAFVFLVIYLIKRKVYWFMLGWPIHIILDIPTHTLDFFPTRFLYPLSDYAFNGIPWIIPAFFIPNCLLLIGFYSFYGYKHYQKRY